MNLDPRHRFYRRTVDIAASQTVNATDHITDTSAAAKPDYSTRVVLASSSSDDITPFTNSNSTDGSADNKPVSLSLSSLPNRRRNIERGLSNYDQHSRMNQFASSDDYYESTHDVKPQQQKWFVLGSYYVQDMIGAFVFLMHCGESNINTFNF